jgi:hypothetical protein
MKQPNPPHRPVSSRKSRSLLSVLFTSHRKLEAEDRGLIAALRENPPPPASFGEFERHQVEQAWRREAERDSKPDRSRSTVIWKGWATVAAAAVAVGAAWVFWSSSLEQSPVDPLGSSHFAEASPVEKSTPAVAETRGAEPTPSLPSIRPSAAEGGAARPVVAWAARIDEPLANEQQRLIADMKGALRFVAASVLPDPMLADVDQAINRLEAAGEGS